MSFSLLLLVSGGLALWVAQETDAVVRRFEGPAIQSAAALRGSAEGQAVVLRGRIDPQGSDLQWGFAIFDREHLGRGPRVWTRFGGQPSPIWVREEYHHPPFTLVTNEGRVPIINSHYAIERPRSKQQVELDRYAGFLPEDEVVVIGETKKGGVRAHKIFGGTPEEFRKRLLDQRALISAERVCGCLLMGLGLVLLARWAAFRIGGAGTWMQLIRPRNGLVRPPRRPLQSQESAELPDAGPNRETPRT